MIVTPVLQADSNKISSDARKAITAELAQLEETHSIRIIFACEAGDRAHGISSLDSGYDVRFVFVHNLEWYLKLEEPKQILEKKVSKELQLSGWDLRRTLNYVRRSSPPVLEWLQSPLVYRAEGERISVLIDLSSDFFAYERSRHFYLVQARRQARNGLEGETVRHKKYLRALRPILATRWIDKFTTLPPVPFLDLLNATVSSKGLFDEINAVFQLGARGRDNAVGPQRPAITEFIKTELEQPDPPAGRKPFAGDPIALDKYFSSIVLGE